MTMKTKKKYGLCSAAVFLVMVMLGVQFGVRTLWLWSSLGGPAFQTFRASDHYREARYQLITELTEQVNKNGLEGLDQAAWVADKTNMRYELFLYSASRSAQESNMARLAGMGLAPGEYLTVEDFQSDGSFRLLRAATNLPEDETMTDQFGMDWSLQGRGEFKDSTILIRYGVELPLTADDALMAAWNDYEDDKVYFYLGLSGTGLIALCGLAALMVHLENHK